jgi:TonB-dependent starch-binding outer membrane protein SusC
MKCNLLNLRLSTICTILCMIFFGWTIPSFAQQAKERNVTGKITDENNMPMEGVTILVVESTISTITDKSGEFLIRVPEGKNELRLSFIGYETTVLQISSDNAVHFQMKLLAKDLDEIVVIGYGTQRKGDLTGSVSNVSTKDFNKGIINSPAQLINGKISGVQIMSNNGSPTSGSTIRIRGGASLNASNDPLIVLDGVPLEAGGISGNSNNFLSLINPNDIESITVLKDASSTAIYGSRASNGVIIITTKKASDNKLRINFSTTGSLQTKTKLADMLSTAEFQEVVETKGSAGQRALLGNSNTDWNSEIYKLAFGTDNNLSLSGALKKVPYRVSVGYYYQDGILNTDNAERITGNISLSPSFLKNSLKVTAGLKGSLNKNRFANTRAIWGAATFNPTLPVYSGLAGFGGYTEALDGTGTPVTSAVLNPVGLLNQYSSTSNVDRLVSNLEVDYKLFFLPELRFHANLGYDHAQGEGKIFVPETAAQYYLSKGRDYKYGPQELENQLLTTYFNYNKNLESINSVIDATVGYDYQYWKSVTAYYEELNIANEVQSSLAKTDQRHVLISLYGRLNYTLASRYYVTATIRKDGTSRFSEDNRWGTFPSVALAWRISEESFLKNLNIFSNLKLRASYGVTGQQEGIGNYNYLPVYTLSQLGAQYIFGSTVVNTYRPEAYVADLKWETTKAYNYGLDFGFFKDRLSGSFEYYTRKTEDLLATVPSPAGTNFEKTILTNVGNVDSKGFEFTLNATPIDKKDMTWNMSFNVSKQKQTIKNLSIIKGSKITNTSVGPTIDSYYFQVLTEGYAPYMFYVYHQLYDESGKPIEGAYADVNGDGEINSSDLYRYHSPAPDYILGFSTSLRYKKWTLGTSLRANIGNYVYNGMSMNSGALGTMSYNAYQLNNLNKSYLKTGFQSRQYLSDYYVENASFIKMDNLTLAYNFGKINRWFNLNVTGMIQNVFTITKYTGVDPEVPNGMDNSFYPRPRIFSLSVGLDF